MDSDTPATATPEVDAHVHNMGSVTEPHWVVDADFARQLGRDLADARETLKRWQNSAECLGVACRGKALLDRAETAERREQEARAQERERCAKVCRDLVRNGVPNGPEVPDGMTRAALASDCAAAIRNLGGENG